MNQVIEEHFRAEQRGDTEGTLATFTDDVVHDVVGRPQNPLVGKDAVRAFYASLFEDLAFEKFSSMHRYFGDNFAVDDAMVDARVLRARKERREKSGACSSGSSTCSSSVTG
jgi:hypothetical protein